MPFRFTVRRSVTPKPRGASEPSTLAVLTWKQSHIYTDVESLYRATIAGNPESWMAHNNLAGALLARGAVDEAVTHIEIASRTELGASG